MVALAQLLSRAKRQFVERIVPPAIFGLVETLLPLAACASELQRHVFRARLPHPVFAGGTSIWRPIGLAEVDGGIRGCRQIRQFRCQKTYSVGPGETFIPRRTCFRFLSMLREHALRQSCSMARLSRLAR